MLPQSMSDTRFIKLIGVLAGEIANDDMRLENKAEHVLDDRRMLPNVFRAQRPKARGQGRVPDCVEGGLELGCKWGHHGDQIRLDSAFGSLEHVRREDDRAAMTRCGRYAFAILTVDARDIVCDDAEICGVEFDQFEHHGMCIAWIVRVVEAQASQQSVVTSYYIHLARVRAKCLPIPSIEVCDCSPA